MTIDARVLQEMFNRLQVNAPPQEDLKSAPSVPQQTGNKTDGALTLLVITPLNDEYELYKDSRCVLESNDNDGQVILKLQDDKRLATEIRVSLQTDKYLRTKSDGTLPSSTRRIHSDLAEENRDRRERLVSILHDLIVEADAFAAGQQFKSKSTAPMALLDELMGYLVQNTFSKMAYIKKVNDNPLPEIQAILRSNDVQQQTLAIQADEANPQALEDLRKYIDLCARNFANSSKRPSRTTSAFRFADPHEHFRHQKLRPQGPRQLYSGRHRPGRRLWADNGRS